MYQLPYLIATFLPMVVLAMEWSSLMILGVCVGVGFPFSFLGWGCGGCSGANGSHGPDPQWGSHIKSVCLSWRRYCVIWNWGSDGLFPIIGKSFLFGLGIVCSCTLLHGGRTIHLVNPGTWWTLQTLEGACCCLWGSAAQFNLALQDTWSEMVERRRLDCTCMDSLCLLIVEGHLFFSEEHRHKRCLMQH